jgi:hypothetical protein
MPCMACDWMNAESCRPANSRAPHSAPPRGRGHRNCPHVQAHTRAVPCKYSLSCVMALRRRSVQRSAGHRKLRSAVYGGTPFGCSCCCCCRCCSCCCCRSTCCTTDWMACGESCVSAAAAAATGAGAPGAAGRGPGAPCAAWPCVVRPRYAKKRAQGPICTGAIAVLAFCMPTRRRTCGGGDVEAGGAAVGYVSATAASSMRFFCSFSCILQGRRVVQTPDEDPRPRAGPLRIELTGQSQRSVPGSAALQSP